MDPNWLKLPCSHCGRARVPEHGVERASNCADCGFPIPLHDELDPIFVLLRGAQAIEDAAAIPRMPFSAHGFVRLVRAVAAELEQLRAERGPFKTLMDLALERGLGEGQTDVGVLELAERLGFRRPGMASVRLGDRLVLSAIAAVPVDARVTRMSYLPILRVGGIPSVRRGTCSIVIDEVTT
jgi:hypothetical protein